MFTPEEEKKLNSFQNYHKIDFSKLIVGETYAYAPKLSYNKNCGVYEGTFWLLENNKAHFTNSHCIDVDDDTTHLNKKTPPPIVSAKLTDFYFKSENPPPLPPLPSKFGGRKHKRRSTFKKKSKKRRRQENVAVIVQNKLKIKI